MIIISATNSTHDTGWKIGCSYNTYYMYAISERSILCFLEEKIIARLYSMALSGRGRSGLHKLLFRLHNNYYYVVNCEAVKYSILQYGCLVKTLHTNLTTHTRLTTHTHTHTHTYTHTHIDGL